jgi:hypothetical protein
MAILGMMLGLKMAMSNDHIQMPVHAHIMVVGWLMSAVFGFFYHLSGSRQKQICSHPFLIRRVSIVVLVVSLYFVLAGNREVEPVTAISSILFFLGMLLFAWIAIPVINKQ